MTMQRPAEDRPTLDSLAGMFRDGVITRRGFLARAMTLTGSMAAAELIASRGLDAQTTARTELVIGQSGDVSRLDPHMSGAANDIAVSFNLFDNLVSRHVDNKLYPALATEWKLLNPTTWQCAIRPNVRFHNGDPLTAADVKFSIERTYDPKAKTYVASVFNTVERVDAPDPQTVQIVTKKPDPLLPARLAFYGGQIIPRGYFERVGADEFNAKPVGSGPVRFASWVKDDRLILDVNRAYWGGKPDADRFVFRPIPDTAARIAALLRGEVDLITRLPPDHVETVSRNPSTRVEGALYAGLYVLVVDSRRPPLDNPKIKQALSLAIDREAIVKELWRGQAIVANGPIPKGDNHYDEGLPPLRYDPALARQRLKEGGYRNEEIFLEVNEGYLANAKPMSEAAVAMWRDVGINVKLEVLEFSVMMQKLREKSLKGLRWGDPASTVRDPDGMMWRLLGPGGAQETWTHPRFVELGTAARFSLDERARGQAYREMTAILLEHLPWIPVLQPIESYGVQKYLEWKPYSSQQIELRDFNLKVRRA
jgi:peptide/nickel transport system substrate-binding protein